MPRQNRLFMRNLIKRPLARQDLKGIWVYTYKQWGERQADAYLLDMNEALIALAQNPKLGHTIEHPTPDLRQYRYKKHLIIYLHDENTLEIVRVLHQRMDISRHTVQ